MTCETSSDSLFSKLGRRLVPPQITRLMKTALDDPHLLSLAAGFTDTRALPRKEVREAVNRLLDNPEGTKTLQYGENQGRSGLRGLLASRTSDLENGIPVDPDALFIANGSQQILALALQTLCDPGDLVLVERPTYFVLLELARGLGIDVRSLPADETGALDTRALAKKLEEWRREGRLERLKAVYLVSYFSNPSSRGMPEKEKEALGVTLREAGVRPALIEDAAYRELYFDAPFPARGILAIPSLAPFPRLYTGTCTKPFATGLKVGFGICPDAAWRNKMLYLKGQHDFGTAHFTQAILEEVFRNGAYDAYLRGMRRHYSDKKNVLQKILEDEKLESLGWRWTRPEGGLYFWLRAPETLETGIDSDFCRRTLQHGVLYVPGELCFGDDPARNCARLSFGALQPDQLAEAGRRFARAAREAARCGQV